MLMSPSIKWEAKWALQIFQQMGAQTTCATPTITEKVFSNFERIEHQNESPDRHAEWEISTELAQFFKSFTAFALS